MYEYEYNYKVGFEDKEQQDQKNRQFLQIIAVFSVLIFVAGIGIFVYKQVKK